MPSGVYILTELVLLKVYPIILYSDPAFNRDFRVLLTEISHIHWLSCFLPIIFV